MRHKRGVNLMPAPVRPARARHASFDMHKPISSLTEWEVLGARCEPCDKTSWLDRKTVVRLYGDMTLSAFEKRLVCRCGARGKAMIGTLGRD
jgi:hypothetical protein